MSIRHYESSYVILEKDMMEYFFKKRTPHSSVYKIFTGIEGNEDLNLDEKFKNCTITFHFTDHDSMIGEITKFLEYKATEGRSLVSYMKTMVKYLIEERNMKDGGHFCMVIRK